MKPMLALLVSLATLPLSAQETLIPANFVGVDVVAIGTLYRDFKFPWIDGWNERDHIQVERVLKGEVGTVKSLPFAWERDFLPGWCLTRSDWRGVVGKRGIWLLTRDENRYRAHDQFFGFLDPVKYLDQVTRILKAAGK